MVIIVHGIGFAFPGADSWPVKGKPLERVGRKATGLPFRLFGIGSQGCQANDSISLTLDFALEPRKGTLSWVIPFHYYLPR
jgi:hypothetical protein